MCDFRPGDEVVCIDADNHDWLPGDVPVQGLREGAVYTVRDVGLDRDGDLGVYLNETANRDRTGYDWGYALFRFRKVQRRDLTAWLSTSTDFEEPKCAPAKKRERA